MTAIFSTIGAFLLIFVLGEILIRKYKVNADLTRKFVHILSGVIVFFLPYYMSRSMIILISISFAILLLFSKSFNLIKSIHSVDRKTLGEVYFPLGVILSAVVFLPNNVPAFQFGILIMAISDGMAAIVGTQWGKHPFLILGGKKSIEGSITFFLTSLIIYLFFHQDLDYSLLVVPVMLTGIEFLLSLGLDNLLLPIVASYLLIVFL